RPLPDDDALWNWIARAARNAHTDHLRTGGRYRHALERFRDWILSPPGSPPAARDSECDSDPLAALDGAIAALPDDERELLDARYVHRRPLEEIGASLGCSARAVEGRLARLRRKLRQQLTAG